MSKPEKIKVFIDEQLTSSDSQEKYLSFLNIRIDENRKKMSKLFLIMILTVFAFPLIIETKITEISIGPFKLQDNIVAIGLIPSIFAFTYYKYLTVWIDLIEQKNTFTTLTSEYFNFNLKSYLNDRLKPYSLIDSIMTNHLDEKSKFIGCFVNLFWVPIGFGILLFPFVFEYYTVWTLYKKFGLDSLFDWTIFLTPILIGIFTVLIIIQVARKDLK